MASCQPLTSVTGSRVSEGRELSAHQEPATAQGLHHISRLSPIESSEEEFEGAHVTGKEIEVQRSSHLQRVTQLVKAVMPGTWGLGTVRTHLSDKGQLQGDIEDDLGVTRCQLLGSVQRKEQQVSCQGLSDQCLTGAPSMPACFGAKCWGFCLAPLRMGPSQELIAWAQSHQWSQ